MTANNILRNVHEDLYDIAGDKNGVFIGDYTLKKLSIEAFYETATRSMGSFLVLENHKPFAVKLNQFKKTSGSSNVKYEAALTQTNDGIFLEILGGFQIDLLLGRWEKGVDPASGDEIMTMPNPLTRVVMKMRNMRFQISADETTLNIAALEGDFIPKMIRLLKEGALIDELKECARVSGRSDIDETYLARVEGAMAFRMAQEIILGTFPDVQKLKYIDLFPGASFSAPVAIHIGGHSEGGGMTPSKATLIIVPDSMEINRNICLCLPTGDRMGDREPTQQPDVTNQNGDVVVGGRRGTGGRVTDIDSQSYGFGDFGMYIPKKQVDEFNVDFRPSLTFRDKDNGFIGYKFRASVSFSDFNISLETTSRWGAILLSFNIEMEGDADITMDIGYGNRAKIGEVDVEQNGKSKVSIRFYPVIEDGVILLKAEIQELEAIDLTVDADLFSRIGSPFGTKWALIGWIFDRVLDDFLERELPKGIEDELRDYINTKSWKLLNINQWLKLNGAYRSFNTRQQTAFYNGHKGSLLVSGGLNG